MSRCSVDIETFSSVDLTKCGVFKYAESPDFEILLIGIQRDDDEQPLVFDVRLCDEETKDDLRRLFTDPDVVKTAWNASFEITCLSKWLGVQLPFAQWLDTMVVAATLGLPRSLSGAGEALGLAEDEQKLKEGKALVKYFCSPCKATKANGGRTRNLPEHDPDKWAAFIEYNRRDVVAERAILEKLEGYIPGAEEHAAWVLDQEINRRGVGVDMDLVRAAIAMNEEHKAALTAEQQALTGLENPNSMTQLKGWLDHEGSLDKKAVAKMKQTETGDRLRALEIRQELGKSSVAKYKAAQNYCCKDGRVHGLFQFYGAGRTGRWAGRGVQLQNLPQNHIPDLAQAREMVKRGDREGIAMLYDSVPDTLSQLIRTMFVPKAGCTFAVADFAAIEARVIAWLADETWRQEVFAKGGDIYCASASQMFKVPVVKHGVNGHLRQKGKIAELALGYGGSPNALINMGALDMGLTEEELPDIVERWRSASPNIVQLWRNVNDAIIRAVKYREPTELAHGLSVWRTNRLLHVQLPSGRVLRYFSPQITKNRFGSESVKYQGYDAGKWSWAETYGGKMTENIVQGIARDCLRDAMLSVALRYPDIVMHIHDEMVVEVPAKGAELALRDISEVMGQPIPWAPGLLLRGDGYLCSFYQKD